MWLFTYATPQRMLDTVERVGIYGIFLWIICTIVARIILVETTVLPLGVLGYRLSRIDAFCIGWLRSVSNQLLPLSGIVLYGHLIRRRLPISWKELASLATPQYFVAAFGVGVLGLGITLWNYTQLKVGAAVLLFLFALISLTALVVTFFSASILELFPRRIVQKIHPTIYSFRQMSRDKIALCNLTVLHCAAIFVRGLRVGVLFYIGAGVIDWDQLLFIVVIAESAVLLQLTPGTLGVREGAIFVGAYLLGLSLEDAAAIALVDRLLMISISIIMVVPCFAILLSRIVE